MSFDYTRFIYPAEMKFRFSGDDLVQEIVYPCVFEIIGLFLFNLSRPFQLR